MKIHRLFGIVYYLLHKKETSAQDLATRFEVSVRTIYRDLNVLCEAGIPIFSSVGRFGGVKLAEQFVLNKIILSEPEQSQILLGLKNTGTEHNQTLISKLEHLFHCQTQNWLEVDHASWRDSPDSIQKFECIKQAILEKNILEFEYHNAKGEQSIRKVAPFVLYLREFNWYLKAFCIKRNAYRFFKLNRMRQLEITDEPISHVYEEKGFDTYTPEYQTQRLSLRIDKSLSYRVYDEFDHDDIHIDAQGNFIITADFWLEDTWLHSYLLSFGAQLSIIEPTALKASIHLQLKKIIQAYE